MMNMYIVRVELGEVHDGHALYQAMDKKMEAAGFKRTITVGNDREYRFPRGEYLYRDEEATSDIVRAKADQIASMIKPLPKPAILVSDAKKITFSGLTQVARRETSLPEQKTFSAFLKKLGISKSK